LIPLRISRPNCRELDTLTEKGLPGSVSKMEETVGPVCTSRVMAADRPYGEFYDFYSVSTEYFGYTNISALGINISEEPTFEVTVCRKSPFTLGTACLLNCSGTVLKFTDRLKCRLSSTCFFLFLFCSVYNPYIEL
jgi:hypothetical protein